MEIIIPIGADVSQFENELNSLDTIAEKALRLNKAKKQAEELGAQPIKLEFDGEDRLSPTFNLIAKSADKFEQETEELVNTIVKLTNVEGRSVASLRARLAANKQGVVQTRANTAANIAAQDALLDTIRAIQGQAAANRGNIELLKLEATALQNLLTSQALSTAERERTNLSLIKNKQEQLAIVGIEQNSVTAKRQLIGELQRLADGYNQGSAANIRYLAQVRTLRKELEGGGNIFNRFIDGLNKIATIQAGFTAISSIIQTFNGFIGQFVSQTKRVESFGLALGNVGLSTSEVNRAFLQASNSANKLGAPLEQVEKSYKRMVPALQAVGANTAETDRFIESITARTQVLGLSTEESGRLLEAFAQVLSKGKLQSEELNQQISELDGAFRTQLADAIGVTTQELEDLIAAGQITADRFVKAVGEMENGVEALTARVASGNATVQQLQNLIANLQTQNIRDIARALEPGIKAFLEIGQAFQQFIADLLKTEFGAFIVDSINGILIGLKNFVQGFLEAAKVIIEFLNPLFLLVRAANDLLKPFGGIIGVLTTFGAAIATAIAITQSYQAILALKQPFLVFIASNKLAAKAISELSSTTTTALANIKKVSSGLASAAQTAFAALARAISLAGSAIKGAATGSVTDITRVSNAVEGFVDRVNTKKLDLAEKFKLPKFSREAKKAARDTKILELSTSRYARVMEQAEIEKLKLTNPEAYAAYQEQVKGTTGETDKLAKANKKAAVKQGLVTGAVYGAVLVFSSYAAAAKNAADIQNNLSNATAELAQKYNDTTEAINKQANALGALGVFLDQYGEALQRTYGDKINKAIEATTKGIAAQDAQYGIIIQTLGKYGLSIRDLDSIRSASDANLSSGLGVAKDLVAANEAQIESIKKQIAAEEAKVTPNQKSIQLLEKQLELKEQDLKQAQKFLDEINKEIDARIKQGKAVDDLVDSLETLAEVTDKKLAAIEIDQAKKEIAILEEFSNTVKDRIDAETALTAQSVASADARVEVYQDERKTLDKLLSSGKINYSDYSKAVIENEKNILNAQKESALAQKKFADDILAEFERIIAKGGELSSIYQGISQSILGAYDGVTGAATNAISALGSLIDSVTEREIAGLETGSERRRQIVLLQLRTQAQLNQLEFQIAQQKLALATRIAVIEARTVQARLQAEAAIAAARGEDDIAAALREAAAAQDEIVQARQDQYKLELQALKIQKLVTDEALNQKAISEGIDPGKNIGTALVGFQDLNRITDEVVRNTRDVGKNLRSRSIQNAEKSFDEQAKAVDDANQRVNEMAEAFKAVAGASDIVRRTVDRIALASKKASTELKSIAAIVSGTQARWMGGSVQAGQTYRVNDAGLGREAFVNAFGRIQMLPASQNINWTAPSSGTIIPARMVKQLRSNSDINNKINVATSQTSPAVSIKASRAMGPDSGNLVKRMSSAMAGASTTNRVTNNITIQSQQPVADASKLMTEAAMMRLRRSRRP